MLSIQPHIAFAGIEANTVQWTCAANSTEAAHHSIPEIASRTLPGQPDEVTNKSSFKSGLRIRLTFECEFLGNDDIGFHLDNADDIVVGASNQHR